MTDKEFEMLVKEGIDALPVWVKESLVNVAFIVEDEANEAQRRMYELRDDELLFGLYDGVPLSERGNDAVQMPDIITIFKKPILESYSRKEDIKTSIENTIWHEVAHYYGHDEKWVEAEEMRRGKTH